MIERTVLSGLLMGGVTFGVFAWMLNEGWELLQARNGILLLMVLFENIQAGNCRSETRSLFRLSPWRNPLLFFGTATAQLLHIAAMYTPGLRDVLQMQPVSLEEWALLLALALPLFLLAEVDKAVRRRSRFGSVSV
jgi:magnesium-transporting ATPase (P-type)